MPTIIGMGNFQNKKTLSRIFAEYNQQDAMLHNLFISVGVLHVSEGFSVHHQELVLAWPGQASSR